MIKRFIPKLTRRDILLLLFISAVYFLITTYNLTGLPIFVDEAIYSRWSQISLHDGQWRFISLTDGKQPLFMWIAMPFQKFIADPLFATRLVSVVSGYFTLLGMWYAGWLIGKKKMAYIASILAFISPYLFFYNRFAVVDAMLATFAIWIFNLSYLLARTRRLDIALILGMLTGMGLLVKSPALILMLLIPASYYLVLKENKLFSVKTRNFAILVIISWILAQAFYYIQKLSPWMYRISQKNEFFVVPLGEIFSEPKRIFLHFRLATKWYIYYNTFPIAIAALSGAYLMLKKNKKLALVLLAWFLGPVVGEALIARLYAPRYIVFVAPFFLLFAAYALSRLSKLHLRYASLIIAILPFFHIYKATIEPLNYPFADEDGAYVDGWSAGQGVKEIASYLIERANASDQQVYIGTEGTFGLLPHGLDLYAYGTENLIIEGFWPVHPTPPAKVFEMANSGKESYFIYNNTTLDKPPENTQLILEYQKKTEEFWIRLYKINASDNDSEN